MQCNQNFTMLSLSGSSVALQCNNMKPRTQKLTHQMVFRVPESLYNAIAEIADNEVRKPNEISRFLLERGIAAYLQDGLLFEMEKNAGKVPVPKRKANQNDKPDEDGDGDGLSTGLAG